MEVIHHSHELRARLSSEKDIAFVPTMGNLHAGHLNLVSLAKKQASCVVVSIFVNPLQFGPNEDLDKYPRTLEADCAQLKAAGASVVFAPSVPDMYPDVDDTGLNQSMTINLPSIANALCGASRPGHFAGMATVVTKLFNLVQPTVAVFGKKDFQQLFLIRALVKQFNFPIKIVAGETMREGSGLAMSSRNGNLSRAEKEQATQLNAALTIEQAGMSQLSNQGWNVHYISVRSADTLEPAPNNQGNLVILGAATLNQTRLIDNIEFCAKPLN